MRKNSKEMHHRQRQRIQHPITLLLTCLMALLILVSSVSAQVRTAESHDMGMEWNMSNASLSSLILDDRARIGTAISSGAGWEIWMQVELVILLRQARVQVAREVPYPAPFSSWRLDVLARDVQGEYAIELKVESASNAGVAVLAAALQDIDKIAKYDVVEYPFARWVVVIAYSSEARKALEVFSGNTSNNSIFQESESIGVMIATVP